MKYTWEYSGDVEYWTKDIFDSVEDCILDAKENYDVKEGSTIAIGEPVYFEPYVDACNILDCIEEDAYEEHGEVAESWDAYDYKKDKEKLEELSDKLTEIVRQWLKDNDTYPNFYNVTNIKIIDVE